MHNVRGGLSRSLINDEPKVAANKPSVACPPCKKLLRKVMLAKRDALAPEYREQAEAYIEAEFLNRFGDFQTYALYRATGSEVKTSEIDAALKRAGKLVLYPKVVGDTLLWGTGEAGFSRGAFGIEEPFDTLEFTAEIAVIPALAIDGELYRLGYGKGYYDRFLSLRGELFTVALAFREQIVGDVYHEPHDIPVKAVVSELTRATQVF